MEGKAQQSLLPPKITLFVMSRKNSGFTFPAESTMDMDPGSFASKQAAVAGMAMTTGLVSPLAKGVRTPGSWAFEMQRMLISTIKIQKLYCVFKG